MDIGDRPATDDRPHILENFKWPSAMGHPIHLMFGSWF